MSDTSRDLPLLEPGCALSCAQMVFFFSGVLGGMTYGFALAGALFQGMGTGVERGGLAVAWAAVLGVGAALAPFVGFGVGWVFVLHAFVARRSPRASVEVLRALALSALCAPPLLLLGFGLGEALGSFIPFLTVPAGPAGAGTVGLLLVTASLWLRLEAPAAGEDLD